MCSVIFSICLKHVRGILKMDIAVLYKMHLNINAFLRNVYEYYMSCSVVVLL